MARKAEFKPRGPTDEPRPSLLKSHLRGGEVDCDGETTTGDWFGVDCAGVRGDHRADDRQAQAGAILGCAGDPAAVEGLEQAAHRLRWDHLA
jgi:hypothetical protein